MLVSSFPHLVQFFHLQNVEMIVLMTRSSTQLFLGLFLEKSLRTSWLVNQNIVVVAQSLSCVQLFVTPWTAFKTPLSSTISWILLKFMPIELVMLSNHLILFCHSLLLLPSIFSIIRVFSSESMLCISWPSTGSSASATDLPLNTQD